MATYYETLGVEPNATPEEIRKAYLRRARALHPDRNMGRTPVEARRAEQAMQQVNVAWDVLSDPTKRSEYDGRHRKVRPAQPAPVRHQARPATTSHPASRDSGAGRAIDEEPGDGSVSVWASLPVLIIIGLLLGILVVTAFADREPSDNRPVVPSVETTLSEGDCFFLVGDTPRPRSCASGTADGQVVSVVPQAGNCPSNTLSVRDPSSDLILCWARMIPGSTNTVP